MRAMVHPLRMRILDALRAGPSTASRLAAELGESSGATSYHLRVLADAEVVKELPDHGDGRDRWWQRTALYFPTEADGPDERALVVAARAVHADREQEAMRRFAAGVDDLPIEWRRAAFTGATVAYLTADELNEFGLDYLQRLEELAQREPPPGSRRVVFALRAVPWIDDPDPDSV
jgi:DNA-binding transcriptional ArsR family regulator